MFSEVEDAGGEDGIGFPCGEDFDHVIEVSGTAAGDDGDADGGRHGGGEFDVVAGLGAIGIHAGEEDFAGTAPPNFFGPFYGIEAGGGAAAMGIDSPFARGFAFGIDGDDDALAAKNGGTFVDEVGIGDRGSVDANFIGTGEEHFPHVFDGPDAATDGERNETFFGSPSDDIDHGCAVVGGGGDVEKHQFVRLLFVVGDGGFHRITGVDEVDKIDAFDDASAGNVEAWNDSFG